ncbi:MAG TPA: DMT family transporter [Egicoccus sp.]|nr:DMT family transporter [Egicoccus sp.]HSK22191.1 DMT family transporter [Egicoccus sp.]
MNRRGQGMALAGATAAISGVAVAINGFGVRAFGDATAYTTAKNLVAGVLLTGLAMVAVRRRPGAAPRRPTTRGGWLRLTAIAVIGGSVPFVLFFEGLSRATAADAAFLHKTLVVWVALLAVPLLGERLGRLQIAAVAVLVAAQLVLVGGLPELAAGSGELLILGATLLWSVEVVVAKQVLREITPATVAVARMGVGSVVLVAWTVGTRGLGVLTGISATQAAWALLTGVVLAAYVATWLAALSRAPAVDVTAVLVGGAVLTALIDAARGTVVLAPLAPGLLLLLVGVGLAVAGSLRRPALS